MRESLWSWICNCVSRKLPSLWPRTDRLSLISATDPNITHSDWTSWVLRSERNALLFCKGSISGVSIHYPHQTSNAWCVPPAEAFQCHYVHRKQRCLVNFTWFGMLIVKSFHSHACRARITDVYTLRLNGNSNADFDVFPVQIFRARSFSLNMEQSSCMSFTSCELQGPFRYSAAHWNLTLTLKLWPPTILWSFLLGDLGRHATPPFMNIQSPAWLILNCKSKYKHIPMCTLHSGTTHDGPRTARLWGSYSTLAHSQFSSPTIWNATPSGHTNDWFPCSWLYCNQ